MVKKPFFLFMKKIFFLLIVLVLKLNAYEYKVYQDSGGILYYLTRTNDNKLYIGSYSIKEDKIYYNTNDSLFYGSLNSIKNSNREFIDSNHFGFLGKEAFDNILKGDLLFLNDLYIQRLNPFLNYLYNDNYFNSSNYINYENYQILYNEDGLAVESIVGGVWKGLYDTPENSGYLYDKDNNVLYHNGNVASLFQKFWYALTGNVSKTLKLYYISILSLDVFILIVAVYLVKVLLGLIIKWISTIINNTKVNVNLGAQKRW